MWEDYVDRLTDKRDDLQIEVHTLRAALEAAEANEEHWRNQHAVLLGIMRNIVNNPLTPRAQVQSQLLLTIERHGGGG